METVKIYVDVELKEEGILDFLKDYKRVLEMFINDKISDEELADYTTRIFVVNEKLVDSIKKIDNQILELRKAMDVTHPEWNENKKKNYIKELITLTDKLIKKHS